MKVHALFGDESALMDRILFLRGAVAKSKNALPETDDSRKLLTDFDGKIDAVRKQIVATTEGGAITGEERLREHTDHIYGELQLPSKASGPFPAMVIMHSSRGIVASIWDWALRPFTCSRSPRRCTTSARSAFPIRFC